METKLLIRFLYFTAAVVVSVSCNKGPKVITATSSGGDSEGTGLFSEESAASAQQPEMGLEEAVHTVTILETLPTTRYVYLRVREGKDEFWIATLKTKVDIGGSYFYRGGLLKTNFESKEHNRVFDRMYLVSSLVKSDHGSQGGTLPVETPDAGARDGKPVAEGSITIASLVADPKKYSQKTVQIRGKCVKVNPNIMGRNWIHLQDGTKDDYDLVVTSHEVIPVGHTITVTGRVSLDIDFGSGYRYDILVEDAQIQH